MKKKVLHPITVFMLTNKSVVVLIKNPESAMSKTETRPSQNVFNSETRARLSKSGLEPKTSLKYYNTSMNYRP